MLRQAKRMVNKTTTIYIVVGILLVAVMTVLGTSVFVRVLVIEVSGTNVYTEEEVLEASRVSLGDNLIRLSVQAISQSIRASLPFVSDVTVERRFPDTLFIEITESVPIAFMIYDGEMFKLDSSGRVLQIGDFDTENLIEVRGFGIRNAAPGQQLQPETGTETRFMDMQEILAAFERENIVSDVSFLDVSNIQNINFGYRNIYRVLLGNAGDLRDKFYNLRGSIDRLNIDHPGEAGDIDVSDPTGRVRFNFNRAAEAPAEVPGQAVEYNGTHTEPDADDTDVPADENGTNDGSDTADEGQTTGEN